VRVVVALGKVAFDVHLSVLKDHGTIRSRAAFLFGHNRRHTTGPGQPLLISSYHPSQQNTSTGKLTLEMLVEVFANAREFISRPPCPASPSHAQSR
jgi:uracil-DNA glycosylase